MDNFASIFMKLHRSLDGMRFIMEYNDYCTIKVFRKDEQLFEVHTSSVKTCTDLAAEKLLLYKKEVLDD